MPRLSWQPALILPLLFYRARRSLLLPSPLSFSLCPSCSPVIAASALRVPLVVPFDVLSFSNALRYTSRRARARIYTRAYTY